MSSDPVRLQRVVEKRNIFDRIIAGSCRVSSHNAIPNITRAFAIHVYRRAFGKTFQWSRIPPSSPSGKKTILLHVFPRTALIKDRVPIPSPWGLLSYLDAIINSTLIHQPIRRQIAAPAVRKNCEKSRIDGHAVSRRQYSTIRREDSSSSLATTNILWEVFSCSGIVCSNFFSNARGKLPISLD